MWEIPESGLVPQQRKGAVHFSDPRPGRLGEIMCGKMVERTCDWTRRSVEVTCAECVRRMRLATTASGA